MEIESNFYDDYHEIGVFGNIKTKEDKETFISLFKTRISMPKHIYFFESTKIPKKIMEFILNYIGFFSRDNIKIYCTEKPIYNYFLKFKVYSRYVNSKSERQKKAIVIGGSAGSLEKIIYILENIRLLDIPIFIVQHLKEDKQSLLPKIIENHTNTKVIMPYKKTKILDSAIYISPPNFQMEILEGYICINKNKKVNYARPSISVLFKSASAFYNEELLAILLCGYGFDGIDVMKYMLEQNTEIVILKPSECSENQILNNAINNGYFSKIASMKEIVETINYLSIDLNITKKELDYFIKKTLRTFGYDFSKYSEESLIRRLKFFCNSEGIINFSNLIYLIENKRISLEVLLENLTVNVTSFFRDPKIYKYIIDNVISYLKTYSNIKIWCAGCSTGEEPYSLGIIFKELGLLDRVQIYATDIDKTALKRAQNGMYPISKLEESIKNYYLAKLDGNFLDNFIIEKLYFKISKDIKDRVLFLDHNLVGSAVINEFQLIFCRNVMIYFNKELRKSIIELFSKSLSDNCYLVVGRNENSENIKKIGFEQVEKTLSIYRLRK